MLYLILGPSGVGKGTQIKLLRKRHPEFVFPKSVTTRKMRPGESDGNPYFFITNQKFNQHIRNHEFLEYAVVHEAARYGTLKQPIQEAIEKGKTVIKELDIQGLKKIQKTINNGEADFLKEKLTSLFILPPNQETLIKRITGRSKVKEAELHQRLQSSNKEIEQADICNIKIVTTEKDSIENVYKKIDQSIVNEV
jgi:guanylate kinase